NGSGSALLNFRWPRYSKAAAGQPAARSPLSAGQAAPRRSRLSAMEPCFEEQRMAGQVTIVDHPLVRHKLSLMRAAETSTSKFRQLMREVSLLLGYEATRDLALEEVAITTPLETTPAPILAGKKLCLVSILRAGNGILDGMLDLVPAARVGHVGLYRD